MVVWQQPQEWRREAFYTNSFCLQICWKDSRVETWAQREAVEDAMILRSFVVQAVADPVRTLQHQGPLT
jgi:hypothetical protein